MINILCRDSCSIRAFAKLLSFYVLRSLTLGHSHGGVWTASSHCLFTLITTAPAAPAGQIHYWPQSTVDLLEFFMTKAMKDLHRDTEKETSQTHKKGT